MICTGAIPFIDDEYIDELDYTVKCVKATLMSMDYCIE
jgi:hypothetical protein